jgi:hypothetical protein
MISVQHACKLDAHREHGVGRDSLFLVFKVANFSTLTIACKAFPCLEPVLYEVP